LKTGGPPVAFLTNHGTYGYGFYEDGSEMLQAETVAYRFDSSGKATKAQQHEQMPFVMVCVFEPEARAHADGITLKNLREWWAGQGMEKGGKNTPMPFAVRGAFSSVTTSHGVLKDVQGTIFGYAVPDWQKDISGGWSGEDGAGQGLRCAFLSGDKSRGGTVLDFTSIRGTFVEWATTGRQHFGMPFGKEAKQFSKMDF
jgi:alpha-acetolactate decarboxylase